MKKLVSRLHEVKNLFSEEISREEVEEKWLILLQEFEDGEKNLVDHLLVTYFYLNMIKTLGEDISREITPTWHDKIGTWFEKIPEIILVGDIHREELSKETQDFLEDDEQRWSELLPSLAAALAAFVFGRSNDEDVRVLIAKAYFDLGKNEVLDTILDCSVFRCLETKKNLPRENIIDELLHFFRWLGLPLPSPQEIISTFKEIGHPLPREFIERSKVYNLIAVAREKPEYLKDYVENYKLSEFVDFSIYLSPFELEVIMDNYIEKLIENTRKEISKPIPLEEVDKILEKNLEQLGASGLPLTPDEVYKPLSDLIIKEAVDVNALTKVPKPQLLPMIEKKAYTANIKDDTITVITIGGGGIGHSGIIVKTRKTVLLMDFGLSVVNQSFPYMVPELKFVDVILLTHAHIDHSGALPILYKMLSKKPWYATIETRSLVSLLFKNTRNILNSDFSPEVIKQDEKLKILTNSTLLKNVFENFLPMDTDTTLEVAPNMFVTAYPSSHLYGSVGFEIEVFGKKIYYTGDFNLDGCGYLPSAKLPNEWDMVLFDGTYYNRENFDYNKTVETLISTIKESSRTLIPAFSIGRSQQILKILEEKGITKERSVKVVGMAAIITKLFNIDADYTIVQKMLPEYFDEGDVLISGHGMLQGGTARRLLYATRNDPNTAVILNGYQAPNTLGWAIKTGHPIISKYFKQKFAVARFSGHTSDIKLKEFISQSPGKKIMIHTTLPSGNYDDFHIPFNAQRFTI